jgi:hypothetical protein
MNKENQMRVLITGGPKTGKTTLAMLQGEVSGLQPMHTDDLIALGWSEASAAVIPWISRPGPWIIEGVAVPRALRKWFAANPTGKPADKVIFLGKPWQELSPGQLAMTKGLVTVWKEVVGELVARGVELVFDPESLFEMTVTPAS